MSRLRIQIMNQLERKSIEFKALKRYWKLIALNIKKERTNLVLTRL
ncbi:IS1167, transposase [Streptococcus sp. oral taxon 056 str. F0418]|nr:IS1167, transposase [Streptococcus sp. oral taxon 056 str. F0418]